MRKPRTVHLNDQAAYVTGTGCVRLGNGGVIELTVAEEELLELLMQTPKITVPWHRIEYELARSNLTIRHLMRGLRDKLGSRSIRTHTGVGVSLQPHFVGTARFALNRHRLRTLPDAPGRGGRMVSDFIALAQAPGERPARRAGA